MKHSNLVSRAVVGTLDDEVLATPDELEDVPQFRIASYNAYNLFGADPDVYTGRESLPTKEEQLRALSKVIVNLDADAIAFQEVQSEPVLRSLFKRVNAARRREERPTYTSFVLVPSRDPRGINVALVTRFAVRSTMTFHDREFHTEEEKKVRFSRDLLGVEMYATPDYRFLFFVTHLKSKIGGAPAEIKRVAEAEEIRSIFERPVFGGAAPIEQDLLLAGDMNDDPEQRTIRALQGDDPATALTDLLAAVEPNYTFPTHNRYPRTRLDYVFASPSMSGRIDGGQTRIERGEPETALAASDHYPVTTVVDLTS